MRHVRRRRHLRRDQINDFQDGADVLHLRQLGFADFAEVFALAEDQPQPLAIDVPVGLPIAPIGFTKAKFDAGDVMV